MNNPWIAVTFGVALIGFGGGLVRSHVRGWRRLQDDPELDDVDREYYHRRYRRRMQVSTMLAVLGFLLAVGDAVLPFQRWPLWTTLYWIGVLLLACWVMLLGFGDMWSSAVRTNLELARVRQKQRELQRQIVEFKHRQAGRTGPADVDEPDD